MTSDRGRTRSPVLWIALLVSALSMLWPVPAQAAAGEDIGYLQTNLHRTGWRAARDSGYSASYTTATGTHSFWIMGDTLLIPPAGGPTTDPQQTGDSPAWFRNNTAARGPTQPGVAPTGHTEIGLDDIPGQLIPDPPAGSTSCPAGRRLFPWATGTARITASQHILIPYSTLCDQATGRDTQVAWGIAEYDPATNRIVANDPAIFAGTTLPAQQVLRSPMFASPYLYLSASICDELGVAACVRGRTFMARINLGWSPVDSKPWRNPAAYRWFAGRDGSGQDIWSSDPNAAQSIVSDPSYATISSHMIHQPSLGGTEKYIIVNQPGLGDRVRIWTAANPTGPWRVRTEDNLGCTPTSTTARRSCRGYILHAELGDASAVAVSFAQTAVDPASPLRPVFDLPTDNQIRLRRIPLP